MPDHDLDLDEEKQEEGEGNALTSLNPDHTKAETNAAARSDGHEIGDVGTSVYPDIGAKPVRNPESGPQERQQEQEPWWSRGGEEEGGQRRRLDGGGSGGDGGAGRLRGSSPREEFVDAGKQGKPLHDQVSFL